MFSRKQIWLQLLNKVLTKEYLEKMVYGIIDIFICEIKELLNTAIFFCSLVQYFMLHIRVMEILSFWKIKGVRI
jgi:hypothetical protein